MIVSLIFEKNIEIKHVENLTHYQCKKYAFFFSNVYNIYLFTFTHIWQLELPLKKNLSFCFLFNNTSTEFRLLNSD